MAHWPTLMRAPLRVRSGARALRPARPRRARARGTCRARRARAGRSGSAASRSSGRGTRRIAVALRRLARERLRLGARLAHRLDERVLELLHRRRDRLARRPHGEHHRQARPLEPEAPQVVVRRRVLERAAERRVADEELRVGFCFERHVLGVGAAAPSSAPPRWRSRASPPRPHLLERQPGDELDRVDGALGGDAEPRQEAQAVGVPRVLDGRDRRHVELAGEQLRLSSVGTPVTSSTSASSRKKTGAMFTYEMRPSLITLRS